jgi:hypothetical protein
MSFIFSFCATSLYGARSKLSEQHAPAAVKALVELALAGIREPVPSTQGASAGRGEGNARQAEPSQRPPRFVGVFVEAWGCIDTSGGKSSMDRFVVQPLYE